MTTLTTPDFTTVFDKTISICHTDENYVQYSVREKMLAFIFTFLQIISKQDSDFVAIIQRNKYPWQQHGIQNLKSDFKKFTEDLIFEGTNSGEIQARPFIANYYQNILWNAFWTILLFWSNDKSNYKENTDVMVEKTIHFSFDLLAPSAIDSGFDLLQNLYKLRTSKK
ncbi:MAG TPA: hypothetical protein PLK15_03380 [Chitinophagales bacterium]|nr:hypothetical protein [Chitinophagales bacterium]